MSTFFNKGQRMPNIFERARACDNWNEGNFPPQEDGYEDTYNTLSNDEKSFVYRHPILAFKFNNNANKAKSAVEHFPNKEDGYGDAVRHCYWCALNQISAGYKSPLAKEFGDVGIAGKIFITCIKPSDTLLSSYFATTLGLISM